MHMKAFFTIVISVSLLVLPVSARFIPGNSDVQCDAYFGGYGACRRRCCHAVFRCSASIFSAIADQQFRHGAFAPSTATFSFSSSEFSFDPATNLANPVTVAAGSSVTGAGCN